VIVWENQEYLEKNVGEKKATEDAMDVDDKEDE